MNPQATKDDSDDDSIGTSEESSLFGDYVKRNSKLLVVWLNSLSGSILSRFGC